MEKRRLGQSDLLISKIGLGCMSLGTEKHQAQKIIEAALEEGINYFDTADLYDFGVNESIVGESLKHVREEVVIATKVGNRFNDLSDGWRWDPSKAYIKDAVKDSLKRLQTDYIDLYQLHGGTIDDPIDETIEAFQELKKEGYIKEYGISSIRPNVIKRYLESSSIVSIMMQYSLLDRRPEEFSEFIKDHGASIVARGPLAKGLLSVKMLEKASEKMKINGYLDYSFKELEEAITEIHAKLGDKRSMNEISLQFNLMDDAVGAVIPGASSIEQLRENVRAVNQPSLSQEEYTLLKELTKASKYEQHR
ncbi:aryl-alcohol dehydrogenase-like predicted oxidoreductase [Bacillus pakistanensis]|uniref:Aryl-alcohol dehydrogenase-like predicted oxidoreductase n=1 Tax=Rossellomorea pakistanensis TaxID=992288 RepID=A0ABS2N9H0_9BACI|nr:aldo/keto reductase [Bacillus pakistanensis]MBM7584430.1 aryl-alcohol dehydrogenase-like predicted oxidoreductase [Bacillus pakistanensis]